MTTHEDPVKFASDWANTWNRRDIEGILRHFAEHVVFTSPVAKQIGFCPDGVVRGKPDLRRYWTAALAKNPALRFEVTGVFSGIDLIVIAYVNQEGSPRTEILRFTNGMVVEGHGTVAAPPEVDEPMSDFEP